MQRTLVCCHARADRAEAYAVAEYLQANCPLAVSFEEAVGAEDFLETAGRALGGDVALLLISPSAVSALWKREAWEPALVNEAREARTEVLSLLLAPCPFPALMKRTGFFDASADRLAAMRLLKRHLLASGPAPSAVAAFEPLRKRLADEAGEAEAPVAGARAFAAACAGDFEAVVHLNCAHRSGTGVIADIGAELGMRLRGPYEENLEALRALVSERRCLLVLEDLDEELRPLVRLGGRVSLLFAASGDVPAARTAGELLELFSAWMRRGDECLHALGELDWLLDHERDPVVRARLARAATALLNHNERFAEAFEMLDLLSVALDEAGDAMGNYRARWEQSWILEHWGLRATPPSLPASEAQQLALPFYTDAHK